MSESPKEFEPSLLSCMPLWELDGDEAAFAVKPTEAKLGLYFELFDLLRLFELTFPWIWELCEFDDVFEFVFPFIFCPLYLL